MDCVKAAEGLSSKPGLDLPPIALAFVEAIPPGVQTFGQAVPSACSFWRKAEAQVFYASAEQGSIPMVVEIRLSHAQC